MTTPAPETTAKETTAKPPAPVFTADHPEYPKALYNHTTRKTKAAKDKEEEDKLAADGYVEEPFSPVEELLTDAEVQQLETLLLKVLAAVKTLAKFSKALQQEKDAKSAPPPAPPPVKK